MGAKMVSSRAFLLLTLVGGASAFQTACDLVEPKPGCEVGDSFYGSGMRFPAAVDFCNEAVCEAGNVSTTDGECVDCAVMDEETCASSAGCSCILNAGTQADVVPLICAQRTMIVYSTESLGHARRLKGRIV